jgi:hypothetical protein
MNAIKGIFSLTLLLAAMFLTPVFAPAAFAVPYDSATVVTLQQQFSQLNHIESELIGPFRVRATGWVVTDSLRQAMGNQAAIAFFQTQLKAAEPALRYYAVIGIVLAGGNQDEALSQIDDAQVLSQTGCMMRNQSLKATIVAALRERTGP